MKKTLLLWLFGLLLTSQVFAQNRTLSGTVKDAATGEALIGVNVTGKGTTIGTVTDIDGKYTLELPKDVKDLVFSYIGYTNVEKPILALVVDAAMAVEGKQLDELVVTGMAIKREKRSTSYSTNTLKAEDLTQGTSNVFSAIQAKTPGVRINTIGGAMGASNRIVLDGEASFLLGNNALIVIDGVPVINSTNSTNQNDNLSFVDFGNRGNDFDPDNIESVSILKGPAATALYGSRATSGVVLITTKSGKGTDKSDKKFSVTVNSNISFQKAYLQIKRQDKFGQGYDNNPDPIENFSWRPAFDGIVRPWTPTIVLPNGSTSQLIRPYSAVKNQLQDAFNIGTTFKNGIALEGASDKFSYYFSYNNTTNNGIIMNTFYKRHALTANTTARLAKNLTSKVNVQYSKVYQRAMTGSGTANFAGTLQSLLQQPANIPIFELRDYNSPYQNFNGYYGGYTANPFYLMSHTNNDMKADNLLASTELEYKPVDFITLTARVGDNLTISNMSQQQPKYKYDRQKDGVNGGYTEELEKRNQLNIDLFGTFNKDVVKDVNINAMLGFNYLKSKYTDIFGKTQNGIVIPGYYNLNNSVSKPYVETNYSNYGLIGLLGQVGIGYKNMLFGEFTARNDWSSTLPAGKRGFSYFSGGLSFVPSELIKGDAKQWLNYLKIRANAGTQGKDAAPYMLSSVFAAATFSDYYNDNLPYQFPVKGLDGSTVSGYTLGNTIGNAKLKPELTTAYEVGAEITALKEYIHVEYTFYHKTSKNLIVNANLPASSGFTRQVINVGKVRNIGHNLLVSVNAIKNLKGVNWELRMQFAKNNSKVLKANIDGSDVILGGLTTASIIAKEGYPFGTFKANDFNRDSLGRIIVGANGAPVTSTTQNIFGSFQPKYTMGWASTLSWKGLAFDVQFDMKKGGVFYSGTREATDFNGTSLTSLLNNREPYIIPNSVTTTGAENTTPLTNLYTLVGSLPESQLLVDASYIKLREASVSYTFDKKFFKKAPISAISVALVGNNLKFWLPKENVFADPESNAWGQAGNGQGMEYTSMPTSRSVAVDFKIKF